MNEDCLAGMACPECDCWGPFEIEGVAVFHVYDDGCSEFSDLNWTDDSRCTCSNCGHTSNVKGFRQEEGDQP